MIDYFKYAGLSGAVESCDATDADLVHVSDYRELQAERDALVEWKAKTEALAASAVICEGKLSDKTMLEMQRILAAHDAEVAKTAYLQCKADFSEPHETWWVNSETHVEKAEKYAAKIRAKAGIK